jgi:hypothetical protein
MSSFSKSFISCLQSTTVAAKRVASLIRFREKRKERCFDKKIRYGVRKEVAQKYRLHAHSLLGVAIELLASWIQKL